MGTKLGNLQVRGASLEEVSSLLPGAVAGQWAEGVVSVYREGRLLGYTHQLNKDILRVYRIS